MFSNDDLKGELFKKIGAETSKDPMLMLKEAEKLVKAGDLIEARKTYKSIIEVAGSNAIRYENQSQYRATAIAYYAVAKAHEFLQNTVERDKTYTKVVQNLIAYAQNAMKFNEFDRAYSSATLAGLVCVVAGDVNGAFEIFKTYESNLQSNPDKDRLQNILYSLGYLIDAIQNTNINALSTAQNYLSKDLKPLLETTKLNDFESLLNSAYDFVLEILNSKVKMPSINLSTQIPKDLLFNEMFDFSVTVSNEGDGIATEIKFNLELPENFEVLKGDKQVHIDKLEPSENKTITYTLRYQTGQTANEIHEVIKGDLFYKDMLGNGHKQFMGNLELEIRSESKTAEYLNKLKEYEPIIEEIKKKEFSISAIQDKLPSYLITLYNQLEENISKQEFELCDYGFSLLDTYKAWLDEVYDLNSVVDDEINSKINSEKEKITEELSKKFQEEKEKAIEQIKVESQEKLTHDLDELRSKMTAEFEAEKNDIVEKYKKEIENNRILEENRTKKALSELEEKLKKEFIEEMNQKSDEFEKTIRELRSEHEKELEEEKKKLTDQLQEKFNNEINEIKGNAEQEIRQLKESFQTEKETELNNLKANLTKQFEEEKEKSLQELTTELNNKHGLEIKEIKEKLEAEIAEQKKKIDELTIKIRELEASSKD